MRLLKELCEASGPPGFEDRIRDIYRREIAKLVDRVEIDGMGNVIAIKKGKGKNPRKVMLAGHLDEIGFVVKHVDDDGFLRLQPLGGFDAKTLIAKRVRLRNRAGKELLGVIGTKPVHIMTDDEKKKLPELDDLFVDVGLVRRGGEPAGPDRQPGDAGAGPRPGSATTGPGKSLDNRVSIYTLIEALRRAKNPRAEIYAVATVQEEIGLRGAHTAAHRIRPDLGVAIDVTLACDVPGTKPQQHVTRLRHGVGIKVLDSSFIAAPKLVEHCRAAGREALDPPSDGDPAARRHRRRRDPAGRRRGPVDHAVGPHPLPALDRGDHLRTGSRSHSGPYGEAARDRARGRPHLLGPASQRPGGGLALGARDPVSSSVLSRGQVCPAARK